MRKSRRDDEDAEPWRSAAPAPAPRLSPEQRRIAAIAGVTHALHDGYTDLIYVMLPIWQAEFGLAYAALGVLRGVFAGTMASLQIPAALISEKLGAARVLALGTALAGLGYGLAGGSAGFIMLLVALFVGGIGASTQHPIASELVARAFPGRRSLTALGTYNFAGDLGKMTLPAALSLMLLAMTWRPALALLGGLGLVLAVVIVVVTPRYGPDVGATPSTAAEAVSAEPPPRSAFPLLLAIGIIDSGTRMAFLLFLPFVLREKGASLQTVGLALTLVFTGGAAGKLACTFIGARIGAVKTVWLTEGLTAAGILALAPLPLTAVLALLPVLGVALNGTSSVLYGSVPALVMPQWRSRALSIFYTGVVGSGAIAPTLYGLVGDAFGVWTALLLVAAIVLITLPLAALLRPALARGYDVSGSALA
jgi:FSR family fosmidomycin resistance protein-like MFS transporter